jgi:hypothetical protein
MTRPQQPHPDSRVTIVQLFGEYVSRIIVIATCCLIVLMTVIVWLVQGFLDKKFIDIRDLVIIAGLGLTPIVTFFFKPVKKASRG